MASTWNKRQAVKAAQRRDELAERASEGASLFEASQAMGMTYAATKKAWQRIKRDLGGQAV